MARYASKIAKMTQDDSAAERELSNEITFDFSELFFSRTDGGGIIRAANSVFQRVAIYSWDEMVDKPHKLIRHPDMPRAVFWLLWDTIKRGEPIGAYVKNKAKDGRFYWVFAIVTPIDGGYLSVRLRPSSDFFSIVKAEYQALAEVEKRDSLQPAAGALLNRLGELGFEDYGAFQAAAVAEELLSLDRQLGHSPDRTIEIFKDILEAAKKLLGEAKTISAAYARNVFVSLNLKIQAAQLGANGAAIGEISNNYNTISLELRDSTSGFIASAEQVLKTIEKGLFLASIARVQRDVLAQFQTEPTLSGLDPAYESKLLEQQEQTYRRLAVEGLRNIANEAEHFRQTCREMRRSASGLEVTRVMGKVECARLTVERDGLSELLDDLEDFQKTIATGLNEIDRMNDRVRREAERLLMASKRAAA